MCHLSPDATEEQEYPLTSYPSNGNPPPEPSLVTPKASQLPSAQPLPLRTSGKEVTYLGNPFRPPPIRSPFRRDHPTSAEPKPPVTPTNYRGLGIYSSCDCRPDQRAVAVIRRNAGVVRPLEKQNLDCGHCNGSWEMRDELRSEDQNAANPHRLSFQPSPSENVAPASASSQPPASQPTTGMYKLDKTNPPYPNDSTRDGERVVMFLDRLVSSPQTAIFPPTAPSPPPLTPPSSKIKQSASFSVPGGWIDGPPRAASGEPGLLVNSMTPSENDGSAQEDIPKIVPFGGQFLAEPPKQPGLWGYVFRDIENDGQMQTALHKFSFNEKMDAETLRRSTHPHLDASECFVVSIEDIDEYGQLARAGICTVECFSEVTVKWYDDHKSETWKGKQRELPIDHNYTERVRETEDHRLKPNELPYPDMEVESYDDETGAIENPFRNRSPSPEFTPTRTDFFSGSYKVPVEYVTPASPSAALKYKSIGKHERTVRVTDARVLRLEWTGLCAVIIGLMWRFWL